MWYANVKSKNSYGPETKTCQIPCKLDIEVKGQRRIGFMNLCNTSSHSDTPMCQTWSANAKPKKKLWTVHEKLSKAPIILTLTDRRMDRESDFDIPLFISFTGV